MDAEASSPRLSCWATICERCTFASNEEVSIIVTSGVPVLAVSPETTAGP
jgi:hypothetical protein